MTTTFEHAPVPHRGASSPAARPDAPGAAPRTGLLALLGEAIAATRAVSNAGPRTSVTVAAGFAARIHA